MHLVNPITGEQIALPSVITMEHVNPIFNESGGCIVVLIHEPVGQISFARVGDDKWTWHPSHSYYSDCIYTDGLLYALTAMGEIHALDLSGPTVTMKTIIGRLSIYACDSMYIVQAPWGGLLLVCRSDEDIEDYEADLHADPATFVRNTGEIKIYSVDTMEKKHVEINNLDGHVLFLGHNQSLCLSTEQYPHLKENYTYFTDDNEAWLFGFKNNRRDIGLFDLKHNSREELVSPQLWCNFPAPGRLGVLRRALAALVRGRALPPPAHASSPVCGLTAVVGGAISWLVAQRTRSCLADNGSTGGEAVSSPAELPATKVSLTGMVARARVRRGVLGVGELPAAEAASSRTVLGGPGVARVARGEVGARGPAVAGAGVRRRNQPTERNPRRSWEIKENKKLKQKKKGDWPPAAAAKNGGAKPQLAASSPLTRTPGRSTTLPPPLAAFAASTAGRSVLGDAAVRVAVLRLAKSTAGFPVLNRTAAAPPPRKNPLPPHHARRQRVAVRIKCCNSASIEAGNEFHLPRGDRSAPMAAYSIARIMNFGDLAKCPKKLCNLLFRVVTKILALSPSLLKEVQKYKVDHPSATETVVANLPEVPQDILMEIFALLEIPDLVRAGSVCNSWRSAYNELRSLGIYKLSQTPCLLYTSESAGDSAVCLYSLIEKREYKITLPEPPICSRILIGSSLGWLVTVDDLSEMLLVNPITGEQIALPSVVTIEHVNPIFNESGALHKYELSQHTATRVNCPEPSIFSLDELRDYIFYKAFVFSDTSTGGCIVVLIHEPHHQISFARFGDDKWTWLPPHSHYSDCIYKDGLLYAVTAMGEIHALDLSGPTVTMKTIIGRLSIYACDSRYIVQAPWGGLLQVWRSDEYIEEDYEADLHADPATFVRNTGEIKIYSVDTMEKKHVEINNLDGHVLFLGHNQSLCLSTEQYPHLKENYTYFTDDNELWLFGFRNNRRDIGLFDLEHNSREELVSPQLWSNFPAPVWITPSFTKLNFA
uniref:F-box domain-containing protein n=1 Tax=Oryza punctata TaxID=4537 RepID=A0A0E0MGL7_ORYPU